MSSCGDGFVRIAFHQAEVFQSSRQYLAYGQMHGLVSDAGLGQFQRVVVPGQHQVVYVFLSIGEFSAHRNGARMMRAIAAGQFGAGVRQHEMALF